MEVVSGILFVLAGLHLFVFIGHSSYRIAKLQWYLRNFNKEGLLPSKDYEELESRFSSFFKLYEPLPDEFEYPKLFENVKFARFVERSRRTRKYLVISLIVLIPLTFLTAPQ